MVHCKKHMVIATTVMSVKLPAIIKRTQKIMVAVGVRKTISNNQ